MNLLKNKKTNVVLLVSVVTMLMLIFIGTTTHMAWAQFNNQDFDNDGHAQVMDDFTLDDEFVPADINQDNESFKNLSQEDRKVDLNPTVTVENVDSDNPVNIRITSSNDQTFETAQIINKETLKKAFQDIATNYKNDSKLWKKLNNTHKINLTVDSYFYIGCDFLTKNNVNEVVSLWNKYTPNDADLKLQINLIDCISANARDIYFEGPDCIHDLPKCNIIKIQSVNWSDNVIHDMKDLKAIHIFNRINQFKFEDFKKAVCNVHDLCICDNRITGNYYEQHFIFNEIGASQSGWTKLEDNIDTWPTVSVHNIDSGIVQLEIESSYGQYFHPQKFSYPTLLYAFEYVATNIYDNSQLWKKLSDNPSISIKINAFASIGINAVNQDIINKCVSNWWIDKYPAPNEDLLKVKSIFIEKPDPVYTEIASDSCITNLPYCNYLEMRGVNFNTHKFIDNLSELNEIRNISSPSTISKDILNKCIGKVKNRCLFFNYIPDEDDKGYQYDCSKWNEVDDAIDLDPSVSLEGDSTIVIESSRTQVIKSQYFAHETLFMAFKSVSRWDNASFWSNLNTRKSINIKVNRYNKIHSESISKEIINDLVSLWNEKYKANLNDAIKLQIKAIDIVCPSSCEVYFKDGKCIHDLPKCEKISIERVNWCDDCIYNLPDLKSICVNNRSEGYSASQLNKAIKCVGCWCCCSINRSIGGDEVFEYRPNTCWKGSDDSDTRVDINPAIEIHKTSHIIYSTYNEYEIYIKRNYNDISFSASTLRTAFQKIANAADESFWDYVNCYQKINLHLDGYNRICSDSISQDIVNDCIKYWPKYKPVDNEQQLTISNICLEDSSNEYEIGVENAGPCIHDLPGCKVLDTYRIKWAGKGIIISNLSNMQEWFNHNRKEGWEPWMLKNHIENPADGMIASNHRWDDYEHQKYKYDKSKDEWTKIPW